MQKILYPSDEQKELLGNILKSLWFITPKFIPRSKYTKITDILVEEDEDINGILQYTLFLPEDLNSLEVLWILDTLQAKFNLDKTSEVEDFLVHIKIYIHLLVREGWDVDEFIKSSWVSQDFMNKILSKSLDGKDKKALLREVIQRYKRWSSRITLNDLDISLFLRESFEKNFMYIWFLDILESFSNFTQKDFSNINDNSSGVIIKRVNKEDLDQEEYKMREILDLDRVKQELLMARKNWNIEAIDRIERGFVNQLLRELYKYPYQLNSDLKGGFANGILTGKEVYCLWFSLITHVFLKELWIQHQLLQIPTHSAVEVTISWERYLFDAANFGELIEMSYGESCGVYKKLLLNIDQDSDLYGYTRKTEDILYSQLYLNLSALFTESWDLANAIRLSARGILIDHDNTDLWNNIAVYYFKAWEYHQSLKEIEKALVKFPKNFNALNQKIWCYIVLKKYNEALESWKEYISVAPWYIPIYYTLSLLLKEIWEWEISKIFTFPMEHLKLGREASTDEEFEIKEMLENSDVQGLGKIFLWILERISLKEWE